MAGCVLASQVVSKAMDSSNLAFMLGAPRLASLSLGGLLSPQALTLLVVTRFIAWCLRCLILGECRWGQGIFGAALTHLKKGLVPHLSGQWDKQQIPTFPQQLNLTVGTNTSICWTNTLILYIRSIYSILLFNLLSLLPCLLSDP